MIAEKIQKGCKIRLRKSLSRKKIQEMENCREKIRKFIFCMPFIRKLLENVLHKTEKGK